MNYKENYLLTATCQSNKKIELVEEKCLVVIPEIVDSEIHKFAFPHRFSLARDAKKKRIP